MEFDAVTKPLAEPEAGTLELPETEAELEVTPLAELPDTDTEADPDAELTTGLARELADPEVKPEAAEPLT